MIASFFSPGYLIYFTYGIRNSVEGKLQSADDITFVVNKTTSIEDIRAKDNPVMDTKLSDERYRKVKDDL